MNAPIDTDDEVVMFTPLGLLEWELGNNARAENVANILASFMANNDVAMTYSNGRLRFVCSKTMEDYK